MPVRRIRGMALNGRRCTIALTVAPLLPSMPQAILHRRAGLGRGQLFHPIITRIVVVGCLNRSQRPGDGHHSLHVSVSLLFSSFRQAVLPRDRCPGAVHTSKFGTVGPFCGRRGPGWPRGANDGPTGDGRDGRWFWEPKMTGGAAPIGDHPGRPRGDHRGVPRAGGSDSAAFARSGAARLLTKRAGGAMAAAASTTCCRHDFQQQPSSSSAWCVPSPPPPPPLPSTTALAAL